MSEYRWEYRWEYKWEYIWEYVRIIMRKYYNIRKYLWEYNRICLTIYKRIYMIIYIIIYVRIFYINLFNNNLFLKASEASPKISLLFFFDRKDEFRWAANPHTLNSPKPLKYRPPTTDSGESPYCDWMTGTLKRASYQSQIKNVRQKT